MCNASEVLKPKNASIFLANLDPFSWLWNSRTPELQSFRSNPGVVISTDFPVPTPRHSASDSPCSSHLSTITSKSSFPITSKSLLVS
jgi:hypothetical protein